MDFRELEQTWKTLGEKDPLWAILSDPAKKDNQWDIESFFESAKDHFSLETAFLEKLGITMNRGRALDFGCGIGRITQVLCQYFEECCGVDISKPMIDLAGKYNKHPTRCRYVLNNRPDLSIFPSNHFDFVYTFLVLQHMEPRYSREYIIEFMRILKPKGVVLFQVPEKDKHGPIEYPKEYQVRIEMYGLPKEEVIDIVESSRGEMLGIQEDDVIPDWINYRYCATKLSWIQRVLHSITKKRT